MYLHRLYLNPLCKEARRDIADPYELHSTLCRAFSDKSTQCPESEFLWRMDPETMPDGAVRVLVQSRSLPDWDRIGIESWLIEHPPEPVDLRLKLMLDSIYVGQRFRFRVRANPSTSKDGKRIGLLLLPQQEAWIERKGREQCGFTLPKLSSFGFNEQEPSRPDVQVTQQQMLYGNQRRDVGGRISIFSALYDGYLEVTDTGMFLACLRNGMGHGKALGLGLLSIVPTA